MTTLLSTRDQAAIHIESCPNGTGLRLQAELFLPQPRDRVFDFFADAFELERITPPWLHFSVLTPGPISMSAGALIDYRLRLRGIPILWQSRISAWESPYRFIDEQTRGPYRRWHHEHQFEAVDGGTVCRDIVEYEVPGGRLVDSLFVRGQLKRIFLFRHHKLAEIFTAPSGFTTADKK